MNEYSELIKGCKKVICINNDGTDLVKDKIYYVESELEKTYTIIDIPYPEKDWDKIKNYICRKSKKFKNRFREI